MTANQRRWRFYKTETGREIAREELAGMPESARAGMYELMRRYKLSENLVLRREVTQYPGGIFALKYSESHNEYRCYFAREAKGGYILLALSFTTKRKNRPDLAAPVQRLKDWRTRGDARRRLGDWQKRPR